MDLRTITESFAVSPQIAAQDVAAIKAAGYRTILCNRPDDEEPGQPDFAAIEAAAEAEGIAARYLPVQSGMVRDEDVTAFAAALHAVPQPVLAYCRTGTRSAMLWSLHEARTRPIPDILAATGAAGYDMTGAISRLSDVATGAA